MRTSTAFFAGMGTVAVAVVAGLGGGLTIANMMSPSPPRQEAARVEQRVSPYPATEAKASDVSKSTDASKQQPDKSSLQSQAPVPYVAATQTAAGADVAAQPAEDQPQQAAQSQAQAPSAAPKQQADSHEQAAAPDDAAVKAREADAKRQADKHKSDRQQQWADRRKYDLQRQQELLDAQARMQDDDAPRDVVIRRDDRRDWRDDRDQEPDRPPPFPFPFPRMNLFGAPDD
jgi:hypothetical protein